MGDRGETENNQFKTLHENSRQAVSTSGQSQPPTCPADVAARRASILLGCYRKGDAEDPQTYAAAVASILSMYPQEVAYRVTDPRSGIAGKSQWLPTVAEVRKACEIEMSPLRDRQRMEAQRKALAALPGARMVGEIRSSGPIEGFSELSTMLTPMSRKAVGYLEPEAFAAQWANKPLTVSEELSLSHPAPEYVGEEL